jgi:ABC-type branched-subunit amino acid transport system ATPase component
MPPADLPQESASSPAGALLEARGLTAGYGKVEVVHGVDLMVRPGEVVALLGPNGAGKTTSLLTLSGDLPALGGEVRWLGRTTASPLHARARQGLGLVSEERSVFPQLTVRDNLKVSGCDAEMALQLFPELGKRIKQKVGLLSGGEQQMLSLARILARHPKILLADELSLGLAPLVVNRLFEAVRAAADQGLGVLLVEQHVSKALHYSDRVYVLRRGEIVLTGLASELDMRAIEMAYLSSVQANASRPASDLWGETKRCFAGARRFCLQPFTESVERAWNGPAIHHGHLEEF